MSHRGKFNGATAVAVPEVEGFETQSFLAAIVESSDDAIYGKTLEGNILSWNHGAERMFGYSAAEMMGRPVSILVPPNNADEVPQILERIKRGERVDHFETARAGKNGERIDVSLAVSPVRDASGKIIGASTTARDITEQKKLREALTQRAKEILDVSTPVLQVWDGVLVAPFIGTLDTQRAQ
jgi:PAS domain S-box-containing protein